MTSLAPKHAVAKKLLVQLAQILTRLEQDVGRVFALRAHPVMLNTT